MADHDLIGGRVKVHTQRFPYPWPSGELAVRLRGTWYAVDFYPHQLRDRMHATVWLGPVMVSLRRHRPGEPPPPYPR